MGKESISWDWLPQDWMVQENFFHYDQWWKSPVFEEAGVKQEYDQVIEKFDELLKEHGYIREGNITGQKKPIMIPLFSFVILALAVCFLVIF